MNYYISDTHFGHENIMHLCNRPFKNVEEQDETLINNWNAKVRNEDNIYILGDFCFRSGKSPKYYLEKLNGKKTLIIGNHDQIIMKNIRELSGYFEEITPYKEIKDDGDKIILCHYPMAEWNGYFHDTLHFYGHIHNNVKNKAYEIMKDLNNAYNVGADILEFAPQTKEKIIELNKKFDIEVAKKVVFER